jgi:hypothetical protein
MAARTSGFSLRLSDICYTLSHNCSISLPPVPRTFVRGRLERVVHPAQE